MRYGPAIPLDDIRDDPEAARLATDRLMAAIHELEAVAMNGTLLAVDGDSLAHRAYHGIPKSIRGVGGRPVNALVGVGELPHRPCGTPSGPTPCSSRWDTLEEPTYRHEALEAYQSGREFEPSILEQLDVLPGFVESFGFAVGEGRRLRGRRLPRRGRGRVGRAGARRDLRPRRLPARLGPRHDPAAGAGRHRSSRGSARPRCASATASSRRQVPDFIALRGDPSDRIPGAPGIGPKKAAELLAQYGSLEAMLADGRFSTIADDLRLYRADRDDGCGRAAAGARPDAARLGAGGDHARRTWG